MRNLYTPQSGAELLVIRGLLTAYGIPHGMSGGYGSVMPTLHIPGYNSQTIWVPDSAFEDAEALIHHFLSQPEIQFSPTSGFSLVRMLIEAIFFGWVIPFQEVEIDGNASNNSLKVDAEVGPVHNPSNNRRAP